MTARIEIPIGTQFYKWTVTGAAHNNHLGQAYYWCQCSCGARKSIASTSLRNGKSRGCWDCAVFPGMKPRHGACDTPTYRSWSHMLDRCNNPHNHAYSRYGGRGITVCDRWMTFENFLADMGERPSLDYSIDRTDNNGNYGPDNCRWATRSEQQRNKRPYKWKRSEGLIIVNPKVKV